MASQRLVRPARRRYAKRPKQGDDRHVHLMNVQRGGENMGVPAIRCATCHRTHNNDMAGIPGAPDWHLAPASMGWDGLSKSELCRTLLDPTKNGGRALPISYST